MRRCGITFCLGLLMLMPSLIPDQCIGLTLKESIDMALQENKEMKAMQEKYKVATYGVMESVGNFLPSVNVATNYSRAEGGRQFEFPIATRADLTTGEILYEASAKASFIEKESHDTKLEVIQPIFQGGALWSSLSMARAQKDATHYELQSSRNDIVLRVQEAYYGVLETEKYLLAMDQAVDLAREHVRVAQTLYDAGMVGKAETLRADVLLSSTLQDRLKAENALTMSRRAFNSLLGRDLDHQVNLEEVTEAESIEMILEDCVQQAFLRNPNLRSFELQLQAAGSSVGLARSSFLPKLNLVFDYGWYEDKYRFDPDNDYWMVMGIASWELFAGSRNAARYLQTKAGYRQIEYQLMNFRDGLKLGVTQAYLSFQEARSRLDLSERALASAEENYRVTEASYREGLAAQVDEIDAQVTLTETRVNQARTRYETLKAQARLKSLIGADLSVN